MNNSIQTRRQRYFRLSSQIAQLDNVKVAALLAGQEAGNGWGRNLTINIGGTPVFVKRLPVTDLEYENQFSTRNLYNLPTFYNYGVGSAGLGVFRELVAHIKTTSWVLEEAIPNFPLLYHHRIIPATDERPAVDMNRHRDYVAYWAGNENVGRYLLDRAAASHEFVLFLEFFPYVLARWWYEHPKGTRRVLEDLRTTIDFLRKNGIIHFDAHPWNVLTDGRTAYLSDFGLVLDRSFDLTPEEASFFRRHTYYDYGEALSGLTMLLESAHSRLSEEEKTQLNSRYGLGPGAGHFERVRMLLGNLKEIHAGRLLKLGNEHVAAIVQYGDVMSLMADFYEAMFRNPQKDTRFPHSKLRQLLKETGFVS